MSKDVYFIHIPKTAGMSVAKLFYENLKINVGYFYYITTKFLGDSKALKMLNEKYSFLYNKINKWHIPFSFLNKHYQNELINKFKLFAIVRNPYDRIISIYGYGIKTYNNNIYRKLKHLREIHDNSFEVNPQNLNNYIHKVLDNDKYKYDLDGHFIPMYKHTHINIDNKLTLICKILKLGHNIKLHLIKDASHDVFVSYKDSAIDESVNKLKDFLY